MTQYSPTVLSPAPMLQKPLFLVGAERSGTTMLRLMLSSHPQLAWSSEFEYAVDQVPAADGWPDLESYYKWLSTTGNFLAHGFAIDRSLSYPQLIDSFLQQLKQRTQKPFVGATVHHNFDRLLRIWPDARLIHIVRDGRDVARSNIKMGWTGNVWHGSRRWLEAEQLWDQLCERLSPDQRLEIVYEDLVKFPEATLQKICAFIGLPYDAAMLSYAKETAYDTPDPAYLDQWRKKLSPSEIQLVEARIGDLLEKRGYALSDYPRRSVNAPLQLWLKIQNYVGRVKFRLDRFGWKLVLQNFLAKRVGTEQWRTDVKKQFVQMHFDLIYEDEAPVLAEKGIRTSPPKKIFENL